MAEGLAEREVAALWVTGLSNVRYLTGFSGSNASLLLHAADRAEAHVLATDGRYATQVHAEVDGIGADVRVEITRGDGWLTDAFGGVRGGEPVRGRRLGAAVDVVDVVDVVDRAELGIEAAHLMLSRYLTLGDLLPEATPRPLTGTVEELRSTKDRSELAVLHRAGHITASAFAAMWGWLAPGMTEREVAHRLLGEMVTRGADGPAFDFIVAAGINGARPHHAPTDYVLRRGDLVTVDAGARIDGYHADMTRTVALGAPDPKLRDIYALVASAQLRGAEACVQDLPAAAVDDACRTFISERGYGTEFGHPSGHGVGLDIHEFPILHGDQAARLRAGMAITVEPGIYLPGVGGVRIEDVVAVTGDGPKILTDEGTPTRSGTVQTENFDIAAPRPRAHELIVL